MRGTLIEKYIHLLVLNGMLNSAEKILLQVVREMGCKKKVRIHDRGCIQIVQERQEECNSIFFSPKLIFLTLWCSFLSKFID